MEESGRQQAILEAGRHQGLPRSKRTEDEVHPSSERLNSGSADGKVKELGVSSRLGSVSSVISLVILAAGTSPRRKADNR